jgi:glycerol kinase
MAGQYVLAIDQGTTSTRAMLFNHDGTVAGAAQEEHEQIYPQAGWVEHDPKEIWDRTKQVIGEVMQSKGIGADAIAAVGITNQRETAVVWDKHTGEPVYNAIVWQDTRTQPIVSRWKADGLEPEIQRKTGLVIATYFSSTKIAWILENVEGVRERAERGDLLFGNTDTWLIWNLTGGTDGGKHITDYTNASRTMLFDLARTDWDDKLAADLNIPRAMLPELRPSSDANFYGMTRADGPLGGEVPICGDAGDQQAALFGQACFEFGQAKNTYGTGNFLLQNTGNSVVPSKAGLLTTGFYALEKGKSQYALEGSIAITGAAIQWLRDNLKMITDAGETEAIAASVKDSGGCYFVPAFSGLFAPYWDEKARGVIVGLTRYVNRAHLVRATLESICYQSRDVAEAVAQDSGKPLPDLRVDGGAVKNDFLMQLQADILGIPVIRPQVQETTALGAAYLAGLATGYWSSFDEMRANWQVDRTFEPTWSEDQRETGYTQWKKAIDRTRGWLD